MLIWGCGRASKALLLPGHDCSWAVMHLSSDYLAQLDQSKTLILSSDPLLKRVRPYYQSNPPGGLPDM